MYPVIFDASSPQAYDRAQVVIRILIVLVLSIVGALGWIGGLLYLGIPIAAAILISQKGARGYLDDAENNTAKWLRWLAAFLAYLYMLTDRFPSGDPAQDVRLEFRPDAEPSVGHVLLRIILAIPHAILLGLLGIVAFILVVISGIMVLFGARVPDGIIGFQRGYLRWNARMYGYLAGLAQAYPPFALDTGPEGAGAAAPPAAAP